MNKKYMTPPQHVIGANSNKTRGTQQQNVMLELKKKKKSPWGLTVVTLQPHFYYDFLLLSNTNQK